MREYLREAPDTAFIFGAIWAGDNTRRGVVQEWNKQTGKKKAHQQKREIDFLSHLRGEVIQGMSPVMLEHMMVRWVCCDVDQKIDAKVFCSKLWVYDQSLFPFKSLNGRWHVYKFFDEWTDVKEAKKIAKNIERELLDRGYDVDKTHTLPTGYSSESPGSWIILPYANDENVCYSPKGNPLNISQFIFRYKMRTHPLIAGAVGMQEQQGGRPKVMWNACLYMHHNKVDTTPEELNFNLGKSLSENALENAKGVEEYDEDYLNRNMNNYLEELCNDRFPFEKTKEKEEKPKRAAGLVSYKFNEFCQRKYPSVFYYYFPFISSECVGLGWALAGVGKTLFMFDLLFHLSQGKKFLHWVHSCPDDPPSILYVEFEMASRQLQERALEIAERENFKVNENNFRIATLGDQPHGQYRMLTTPEGRKDIEISAQQMFEETGKKPVIVIDNIRFSMGDFDEKEGSNWIPLVMWCAEMRAKGFSIIYLHHATNVGDKFSGSSYANSNVNVEFMLRRPKEEEMHPDYDEDHYTQFVFQFKKMRENVIGALTPFLIVTCKTTHQWYEFPILNKTERKVEELLDEGWSVDRIVKENKDKDGKSKEGFSRANVFKVKKKLEVNKAKDETKEHY